MLVNNLHNILLREQFSAKFQLKFISRAVLIFKCLISTAQRKLQLCQKIEKHHEVNSEMHEYKLMVICSRQSVHAGHRIFVFITLYIDEGRQCFT